MYDIEKLRRKELRLMQILEECDYSDRQKFDRELKNIRNRIDIETYFNNCK